MEVTDKVKSQYHGNSIHKNLLIEIRAGNDSVK